MNYSKYIRNKKEWLILVIKWLFISISLGILFYKSFFGILLIMPFGIIYERIDTHKKIDERKKVLLAQFIEFLQIIISSLKAGISLERSIESSKERLFQIYTEDSYIIKEVSNMKRGLRMNINIEELICDFGERSGIEEIKQFAEVCKISKRTGGNIVKIMEHTISCIVSRAEVEREISTMIAGKRLESRLLSIILPLIILYINISLPDLINKLYINFSGNLMMTGILIGYGICILWLDKITNIRT